MNYPHIAFAGGVINALIGIVQPSWQHVLLGVVIGAYALVHRDR